MQNLGVEQQCLWCHQVISGPRDRPPTNAPLTHGLCVDCVGYLEGNPIKLGQVLESFATATVVVNSRGTVVGANGASLVMLGKAMSEIAGELAGNVIECSNARRPGGCGRTVHCDGCGIRRAFTETLRTGVPSVAIKARTYRPSADGTLAIREWVLTTERLDQLVLLRIEPAV